jgi:hypothetical protein
MGMKVQMLAMIPSGSNLINKSPMIFFTNDHPMLWPSSVEIKDRFCYNFFYIQKGIPIKSVVKYAEIMSGAKKG